MFLQWQSTNFVVVHIIISAAAARLLAGQTHRARNETSPVIVGYDLILYRRIYRGRCRNELRIITFTFVTRGEIESVASPQLTRYNLFYGARV